MTDKNTTVEIDETRLREILTGLKTNLTLREKLTFIILIPPAIGLTVACFVFAFYMAKLANLL